MVAIRGHDADDHPGADVDGWFVVLLTTESVLKTGEILNFKNPISFESPGAVHLPLQCMQSIPYRCTVSTSIVQPAERAIDGGS